jgi:hypothetical protein
MKVSRLQLLFYLYCFVLLLGIINLFPVADYGYIYSCFFIVCSLFLFPLKKTIGNLIIISFFFILIFLYTHGSILYMINTLITFGIVIHLLQIASWEKINITGKDILLIKRIIIAYIALNLLASFSSAYFSDAEGSGRRFQGFMSSSNSSVTVIILLIMTLLEIYKQRKFNVFTFVVLFIVYLYFCFVTKSRTALFALPYFLYQLFVFKNTHNSLLLLLSSGFLIVIILFLMTNRTMIAQLMRLDANEISFLSRANLYLDFLDELKKSFFVIPHGFHSGTIYARLITKKDNWSPHNSFLEYLYDLGGIFIGILAVITIKLKPFVNCNLLFIFLFAMSSALHNMAFSLYVWAPLFFILLITRKKVVFL